MFLFNPPPLLLLPLLQTAIAIAIAAAAAPSTNTTTNDLATPPPATPNFSLGRKIPFPTQPSFPLLTMLFLTCDGLYTFAPFGYTSAAPAGLKRAGTLAIQVEGNAEQPASAFQIRHAMWALWLGAVTQLDERDYRPGVFVMDVRSGGGATRIVGSIIYRNDNPAAIAMAGGGNGSVGGGAGVAVAGAIEPVVVAGVDVTSRSRRRRRRQQEQEHGSDDAGMATGRRRRRRWSSPAPPTAKTTVSFPGFNTTATSTAPPQTRAFYNIQITGVSASRISLTSVFTTVYESMVARASLPDRQTLTQEWLYTSMRSGYVFGIRPPEGMPAAESPPFEAMMGAMANLPRALQSGRYSTEVMFDVLDGQTDERVLQGFLVLEGHEGGVRW